MSSSQAYLVNAWRGTNQGTQLKYGGSSGFDALLAGRVGYGVYSLLNLYEYTWTSSQYGTTYAWRRCLQQSDSRVGRWNTFPKGYGFSIRCIKN